MRYTTRLEIAPGTEIIRQGDPAADLYFVESGQVTVSLSLRERGRVRLRKMGAGTVAGEVGLYLGGERSASVVADTPSVVHRLGRDALARMAQEDPTLVAAFHQCMAKLLAERLINTNEALRAVLD